MLKELTFDRSFTQFRRFCLRFDMRKFCHALFESNLASRMNQKVCNQNCKNDQRNDQHQNEMKLYHYINYKANM